MWACIFEIILLLEIKCQREKVCKFHYRYLQSAFFMFSFGIDREIEKLVCPIEVLLSTLPGIINHQWRSASTFDVNDLFHFAWNNSSKMDCSFRKWHSEIFLCNMIINWSWKSIIFGVEFRNKKILLHIITWALLSQE